MDRKRAMLYIQKSPVFIPRAFDARTARPADIEPAFARVAPCPLAELVSRTILMLETLRPGKYHSSTGTGAEQFRICSIMSLSECASGED